MNKKKITTFGEFCELRQKEPENVYQNDIPVTAFPKDNTLDQLRFSFDHNTYYHIPPKKKKTMAMYYYGRTGEMKTLWVECSTACGSDWIKIPNTEFEVDE